MNTSTSNSISDCEATCSVFGMTYFIGSQCVSACNSSFNYLSGSACLSSCGFYSLNTDTTISSYTCLSSCFGLYFIDANSNKECVSSCSVVSLTLTNGNECVSSCSTPNIFITGTTCASTCSSGFYSNVSSQHIC